MRNWFTGMYLGAAIMVVFASCSKGGEALEDDSDPHVFDNTDTLPPVVEITTPALNQVFSSGNVIDVTGKVSDENGLFQGSIRITNDANGLVVAEQLYVIHAVLQYNFTISHTTSVTVASDYTVTVLFEDHGFNITSKSVKVKVNP
jgi:Bacterial Ig domain